MTTEETPDAARRGATYAVVGLRLDAAASHEVSRHADWEDGPLPVEYADAQGVRRAATVEGRQAYFAEEVAPLLYGSGVAWSSRCARTLDLVQPTGQGRAVSYLGVELHRVALDDVLGAWLLLHVVVTAEEGLASDGDLDLRALDRLLHPSRHLEDPPPPGLAGVLGLPDDGLARCLRRETWFTLLRSCRDQDLDRVLHGAATASSLPGSGPRGQGVVLSESWSAQVGPRGLGFARRLDTRDAAPVFHDTSAPGYVRSLYSDTVHLARVQDDLLRALRLAVTAELLDGRTDQQQLAAVLRLQRLVALFRVRVWWSNIGRGPRREGMFTALQEGRDLRDRMDDLATESSSLQTVVETLAARRVDATARASGRRTAALTAALALVAALSVPQTVLDALSYAREARVPPPPPLTDAAVVTRVALGFAAVVAALLVVAALYAVGAWAWAAVRSRRRPAPTATGVDGGPGAGSA